MFLQNEKAPELPEGYLDCSRDRDFKSIYDETFDLLFKVSYRIVLDEEAAEDLVHDSYIKANEKKMVFPSLNDAKFWLIRVVKNASLNYAKRKLREAKAYQKALYESPQHMDGGETDYLKNEAILKAQEALNQLPPKLKEVIVLKEYGDLNYKEIGAVLGITEGNVKVRVFRAREQLAKLIGEENVYLP